MAEVELTRDGGVLTITLNRPDVLNALNHAVHEGLHAALAEARDPAVRAVVVTGAGRGFCVGQDLQEFREGAADVSGHLRSTYHVTVLAIRSLEKPVLAAVNGPAAGAGLSLALACDVRGRVGSRELRSGLQRHRTGAGFGRHVARPPPPRSGEGLRVALDRSQAPALEALEWGLVSEVVPEAAFAERTREIAERWASLPTRAVWETKRLLDAAETSTSRSSSSGRPRPRPS